MAEKVVRFPVEAELWKRFRVIALTKDRPMAEYLTDLIEKEVKRVSKAQSRRNAGAN